MAQEDLKAVSSSQSWQEILKKLGFILALFH
jgi:hypothetical protein